MTVYVFAENPFREQETHTTSFPKTWLLTLTHVSVATKGVHMLCEVHK